ncbi:SDR family NAD(P)-dependent oxidoreductase [Streptomyces sp. NPDC051561]|uniref:SDR family NAD(P)-dependent oxidoreductase n=1 Tax=Streptomyces sp. NPDC051561 TaxID=3365658 RepID=UPI0037931BD9
MTTGWNATDIPDQSGRIAIVTGANSGIGLVTARELARRGAQVILACRDERRGRGAEERIRAEVPGARVEFRPLDLADLSSVREFSASYGKESGGGASGGSGEAGSSGASGGSGEAGSGEAGGSGGSPRLDLLINNAGVMALPQGRTADGFETQFGVNHLGHFALTGLLLPHLLATPGARVVSVSSGAHALANVEIGDLNSERRYRRWPAYARPKTANLLFIHELARRLAGESDLVAAAAHPGYARTNLMAAGPAWRAESRWNGSSSWAGASSRRAPSPAPCPPCTPPPPPGCAPTPSPAPACRAGAVPPPRPGGRPGP